MVEIQLFGLPKISLNKWYAGQHWSKRVAIKNTYKKVIKSQYKNTFEDGKYLVSYEFTFIKNPLDASNCVAMIKIIEDILFVNDKWDLIKIGGIESKKGKEEKVKIKIEKL